ncbi:hypothetical protein Bca52824_073487 [Brassica carinata]|uniref:Uncharacterized protein n=1 Tax=Brassica carinata TaxID=52824 RepID=A0A8X7QAQ1_BRACI|nr:hypothetical protein Bca52824_073487 [Brassica carinata]
MACQLLPNLPDEIVCKIIGLVGEDSIWHHGPFLRAGKRGFSLVHEPSVLQTCNVTPMLINLEIRLGGKFRESLLECVSDGNTEAVYYEGLYATTFDVEHAINVLEPNVPTHALSTLDVGVFNVCLGKDKEASKLFLEFAAIHDKLRSDAILELTDELEWRLTLFLAPHLNSYPLTFKFPDDEVIKSPKCLYGHDYTKYLVGSCKNYRLFWICFNIAHML